MKVMLRYQMSEFDCGPTAVMNAIQALYDRDEIPPEFPKHIMQVTLDDCNECGLPCRRGTSKEAMQFLAGWFSNYGKRTGYPIQTDFLEKEEVHFASSSRLRTWLEEGGVAVILCMYECPHYITLTGIEGDTVKAFDPYCEEQAMNLPGVEEIQDHPQEYNRLIKTEVLDQESDQTYAMSKTEKRMALLIKKTGKAEQLIP